MTAFEIRAMTPADVDEVGEVTLAGGFGDRRAFFGAIVAMVQCRPLVATLDGRLIGTALGSIHGDVGWVGVVFVVPELRRQGIGRALTEAVCDILDGAGCHSLVLVATELGRPMYERLGFRERTRYHMFAGDPLAEAPSPPPGASLRPIRPSDLDAIEAIDREATGEQRRPLIEAYASRGWLIEDERLRGFVLPTTRGNGALIAQRPEDAVCLLDMHRHLAPQDGRVWAGLPTENEAGIRFLAERGWFEWRSFPRLLRGPEPSWRPDTIWGQFNHAMG